MDTMEHFENTTEAVVGETERERRQFAKMTKTPIPKLVVMLGIPTMLNMMVSSLYNPVSYTHLTLPTNSRV